MQDLETWLAMSRSGPYIIVNLLKILWQTWLLRWRVQGGLLEESIGGRLGCVTVMGTGKSRNEYSLYPASANPPKPLFGAFLVDKADQDSYTGRCGRERGDHLLYICPVHKGW
jgi:hypothetical protein